MMHQMRKTDTDFSITAVNRRVETGQSNSNWQNDSISLTFRHGIIVPDFPVVCVMSARVLQHAGGGPRTTWYSSRFAVADPGNQSGSRNRKGSKSGERHSDTETDLRDR